MKDGFAKRQEMAKEGQKLRQEMQAKLESLKKDRDALQPQRDQLDGMYLLSLSFRISTFFIAAKKQEAERLEKQAKDLHRDLHNRSFSLHSNVPNSGSNIIMYTINIKLYFCMPSPI